MSTPQNHPVEEPTRLVHAGRKFYTEEGNWDVVGNNTPVFFLRDPLKFPDLNHAVKRDPKTNMRSADNNWDF